MVDRKSRYTGLVEWAEVEVKQFAETFRRQVYGPTSDPVVIEESLRITAHHNRKVREIQCLSNGSLPN